MDQEEVTCNHRKKKTAVSTRRSHNDTLLASLQPHTFSHPELSDIVPRTGPVIRTWVTKLFRPEKLGITRINARVSEVEPNSQADVVGVKPGWLVHTVNHERARNRSDIISNAVSAAKAAGAVFPIEFEIEQRLAFCCLQTMMAAHETALSFPEDVPTSPGTDGYRRYSELFLRYLMYSPEKVAVIDEDPFKDDEEDHIRATIVTEIQTDESQVTSQWQLDGQYSSFWPGGSLWFCSAQYDADMDTIRVLARANGWKRPENFRKAEYGSMDKWLLQRDYTSDWRPKSSWHDLDIYTSQWQERNHEDPRMFTINNEIYVLTHGSNSDPQERWVHIVLFRLAYPQSLVALYFEKRGDFIQKNWQPMEVDGKLFFVYGYDPLIMVDCTGAMDEFKDYPSVSQYACTLEFAHESVLDPTLGSVDIRYGIHGGVPLVRLDEDHWWGMVHQTNWFPLIRQDAELGYGSGGYVHEGLQLYLIRQNYGLNRRLFGRFEIAYLSKNVNFRLATKDGISEDVIVAGIMSPCSIVRVDAKNDVVELTLNYLDSACLVARVTGVFQKFKEVLTRREQHPPQGTWNDKAYWAYRVVYEAWNATMWALPEDALEEGRAY